MSMLWQRFTERAKRAVLGAQEAAAGFGASEVEPEHLLLALVAESDTVATKVLERLGASVSKMRGRLQQLLNRDVEASVENTAIERTAVALSPRSKRVLDWAYDEARRSNTNYIGTEHLLLGIVRECDGFAFRTLVKQGVDIISCRREVVSYLGGEMPSDASRSAVRDALPPEPSADGHPHYSIRRFNDPHAAESFLNTASSQGARLRHAIASHGGLWIVMESPAPLEPAAASDSAEAHQHRANGGPPADPPAN